MKIKTILSIVALAAMLAVPQGVKAQQITFDFDAAGTAGDALTRTTVTSHKYGYAYGGDPGDPKNTTCKTLGNIYWINSTANLNSRNYKFMTNTNHNDDKYDATEPKGLYLRQKTLFVIDGLTTGDEITINTKTDDGYTISRNLTGYKYENTSQDSGTETGATISQNSVEVGYKGNITNGTPFTVTGGGSYVVLELVAYQRIHSIVITPASTVTGETLSVGSKGFATFCSNAHLNLTGVSNIIAYTAGEPSAGEVTLTPITIIPANTGVLLKSANGGAAEATAAYYSSPCAAKSGNNLIGTLVDKKVTKIIGSYFNYYLTTSDAGGTGDLGFYLCAEGDGTTITAGKAYLQATTSPGSRGLTFVFDDGSETTGINSVQSAERSVQSNEYYNLAGQRVAQPTKGLYIVNGKKVIIK